MYFDNLSVNPNHKYILIAFWWENTNLQIGPKPLTTTFGKSETILSIGYKFNNYFKYINKERGSIINQLVIMASV